MAPVGEGMMNHSPLDATRGAEEDRQPQQPGLPAAEPMQQGIHPFA